MARHKRRGFDADNNYWIGYADLLSNSLMILLLTVSVTSIARSTNEKPPLLRLTEQESFRFDTGSYLLTSDFRRRLDQRIPEIRKTIERYRIDSVEVIGHTDGQPSPGRSNLDLLLPNASRSPALTGYQPGSNSDLGLLRALAVANHLRLRLDASGQRGLVIRSYSASSLIASDGRYAPADRRDHAERRRIEVRFTRSEEN
jgi:outer membrane protein OmpA-like peptidoglycan-associated protein